MTFGEFLNKLLKSKNVSVSRLAELTGSKSRNSIQRILKDECSISIIEAFKSKLIELELLELTTFELEQLEQALEVNRVGQDTFAARKIFLQVFDNCRAEKSEGLLAWQPAEQKTIPLRELLATYKNFVRINLIIFDAVCPEFTYELVSLICTSPPGLIYISQILYLGNSRSHVAESFVSIIKLINYEHYNAYYIDSDLSLDCHSAVASIIIDKETSGGDHYTDLIKMDSGHSFSYITDVPGNSLYLFYLYHFNRLKANGKSVRRIYPKQNPFDTVVNICDLTVPLRENTARYRIEHGLDYVMIPYDILVNMLAEADYFGLGENNPMIQKFKQLWHDRFYNCFKVDTLKVSFLTKRGLLDFVKNRVLSDHFTYLRPFTKEEVKTILEFNLEQIQEKNFLKILLLKNDYSLGNIQFIYYENKVLWLYDASSGYNDSYFEGYIDSMPILEVYDDFLKNELLRNHTWPESETIEFFKYLISIV